MSFVRAVISAQRLPPDVRAEFERDWRAVQLVEGYGLTEASPVTHVNPPGQVGNRPGTIGWTLPDTEAKVIDPDTGRELGVGEVGELIVRGPQVMKGYFNNPLATEQVLRDGWLPATWPAATPRAISPSWIERDIIKTSGFLVYPAEVEEVLRGHPDVSEAAVIGVPTASAARSSLCARRAAVRPTGQRGPAGGALPGPPGQAQAAARDRGRQRAAAQLPGQGAAAESCGSRRRRSASPFYDGSPIDAGLRGGKQ
ncbi:MAG: AMP-binding protein [Gemmataceae bacterium]